MHLSSLRDLWVQCSFVSSIWGENGSSVAAFLSRSLPPLAWFTIISLLFTIINTVATNQPPAANKEFLGLQNQSYGAKREGCKSDMRVKKSFLGFTDPPSSNF